MSDLQADAQRLLFSKLVSDEAKRVAAELLGALTDLGVVSMKVKGPDGTVYGKVTVAEPKVTAKVVDEEALLAWVEERHPDWLIPAINPLRLRALLDGMNRLGDPVDSLSGEVVPGVELIQGDPYLSTTKTDEGRDALAAMIQGNPLVALAAAPAPPPADPTEEDPT